MSYYGMLWPSYFDGPTGREIAKMGGADAQIVGVYLMSGSEANMIGLYRLPLAILQVRLGSVKGKRLERALSALGTAGFAHYDQISEYVWVVQMAHYRLQLDDKPLSKDDNRVIYVNRLYADAEPNPFLGPFYARYRSALHLKRERVHQGPAAVLQLPTPPDRLVVPSQADYHLSSLPSPLEGPLKPVTETVTVPGTETVTETIGSSALAQTPSPEPAVLRFPTVGAVREWALTERFVVELSAAYPHTDIRGECIKALLWVKTHSPKTARGMPKFLNGWMARTADRGGRANGAGPVAGKGVGTMSAIQAAIQRRQAERERQG